MLDRMTEPAAPAWQEHLAECEICQVVVKRGERALMFNLCTPGRVLYYPAWQVASHKLNPGGADYTVERQRAI
jgi:hypothetical protein